MHLIAMIFVFLLCWPTFWIAKMVRKFDVHKKIELAQVERIYFLGDPERVVSSIELEKFVEWFNDAVFIQKKEFEKDRTDKEGIAVQLKTGEEIIIVPQGKDFDVTRRLSNRSVTYWARQQELRNFLVSN
jgi:hypothetical protein